MKLAEALLLRADLQKRAQQLRERLLRNARYQEGEEPAEDPAILLSQLAGVFDELESLIQRINHTNATSEISEGITLTDALA